jgi:hypothetical protein
MKHFGGVISEVLGWPLYCDTPVLDADTVYIVGLYDPPYYGYTFDMTKNAKKRIIHWCGTDAQMYQRVPLPEATHLCETEYMRGILYEKGIISKVVTLPTLLNPPITPLPDERVVSIYVGSSPGKYGESTVRLLADSMPDVTFHVYVAGQYDAEEMRKVIARTKVYLRLVWPDGSANSAREYMQAGRPAIITADLPYAVRIRNDDIPGIISALETALAVTEPNEIAANYYKQFNSAERYLHDLKAAL